MLVPLALQNEGHKDGQHFSFIQIMLKYYHPNANDPQIPYILFYVCAYFWFNVAIPRWYQNCFIFIILLCKLENTKDYKLIL